MLWILPADFNLNEVIALLCYLLSFSIYKLLDSIYFPLFSLLFCTSFFCVHHPLQRLVLASFSRLSFTFWLLLCCRFSFQLFLVYLRRAHTIYTNRQQRPNNNTSSNNNTYSNCRCAESKTPTAQNWKNHKSTRTRFDATETLYLDTSVVAAAVVRQLGWLPTRPPGCARHNNTVAMLFTKIFFYFSRFLYPAQLMLVAERRQCLDFFFFCNLLHKNCLANAGIWQKVHLNNRKLVLDFCCCGGVCATTMQPAMRKLTNSHVITWQLSCWRAQQIFFVIFFFSNKQFFRTKLSQVFWTFYARNSNRWWCMWQAHIFKNKKSWNWELPLAEVRFRPNFQKNFANYCKKRKAQALVDKYVCKCVWNFVFIIISNSILKLPIQNF